MAGVCKRNRYLYDMTSCAQSVDMNLWLQMAARETGIGAVETYMHAGKLLALELLVKVLENQAHTWSHVRQEVSKYSTSYFTPYRTGTKSSRIIILLVPLWDATNSLGPAG